MRHAVAALALTFVMAAPVAAQDFDQARPGQPSTQKPAPPQKPKPPPKPKTPKLPLGLRAAFVLDSTAMSADATLKALTGSSTFIGTGGEGDLLNLWRKMYVRFGLARASRQGERAFLVDADVISTGVPIELGVTSVEISAGWRTYLKKHPKYAWYAGAGLLFTRFSETSDLAEPGDNETNVFRGWVLHAGLERSISKRFVAGVEGQLRTAGGALGEGGLSEAFNERSLGGSTIRGLIGIRLRK